MTVQTFETGPIDQGGDSDIVPFVVLLNAGKTFIRVLAHFQDDQILGGTPPTLSIRAGQGPWAEVAIPEDPPPEPVPVPILGSDKVTVVASVTLARTAEDIDTYLAVIEHGQDSGPWRLSIRNDEAKTLAFFILISDDEAETLQPWIQLEGKREKDKVLISAGSAEILVRNVGAKALTIEGVSGDQIPNTPFILDAVPSEPVRPHRTATIRVKKGGTVIGSPSDELTIRSNDQDKSHGRIAFGDLAEPIEPSFDWQNRCKLCGCTNFSPRDPPDEVDCRNCFHVHVDSGPKPIDGFKEGHFGPL